MIIVIRAVFYENIYKFSFMNARINYRRERGKLSRRTKKQKYNLPKKKFLYFFCLFINYNCIIDSCYLIKYKAKQKHLLPIYVTNNELKKVCISIYYKNGK